MSKIDFETIERTCCACPSQWQGYLTDGRMFYARYRWGRLAVEFSNKPVKDVSELFDDCTIVYDSDDGDGFDGLMTDWKFYGILLKNNLLDANSITRVTIKYFSRFFGYLEDRAFARSLAKGIRRITKYGLFGDKADEDKNK